MANDSGKTRVDLELIIPEERLDEVVAKMQAVIAEIRGVISSGITVTPDSLETQVRGTVTSTDVPPERTDQMPERDDIPTDPLENDAEFIADRRVGLQAGLNGEDADDAKSKGWQRGWADAQE